MTASDQIPDDAVCRQCAEQILRASNSGGPFAIDRMVEAARKLLAAERDRCASIAEEMGHPAAAIAIRGVPQLGRAATFFAPAAVNETARDVEGVA